MKGFISLREYAVTVSVGCHNVRMSLLVILA